MEALIVFLSELVFVLLTAGVIFSIVALLTIVLGGINLGVNKRERTQKVKWLRRLSIIFTAIFLVTLALSLVVNFFLFEPTARVVLDQVKTRTGIDVTFASAKGNIFTGTVTLQGVKCKRENHETSRFDIQAKEIDLDMDMIALLSWRTVMEDLKITGLTGTFQRIGTVKHLKPRKAFEIENFILEDCDLVFSDSTRGKNAISIPVKIKKLQSTPFRSYWSIYDILFNSTGSGTLGEQSDFTIYKKESPEGKETWWTFNDLPLETLAAYVGGPFNLISEGGVFLEMQNQRVSGEKPAMLMNFHLAVREVKARVPESYPESGMRRNMAERLVTFINEHSQDMSFNFSFQISEATLKFAVSLEGLEFWKLCRENITKGLVHISGKAKEKIKELGKKGAERFKNFLEKRRKKKEQQ